MNTVMEACYAQVRWFNLYKGDKGSQNILFVEVFEIVENFNLKKESS